MMSCFVATVDRRDMTFMLKGKLKAYVQYVNYRPLNVTNTILGSAGMATSRFPVV